MKCNAAIWWQESLPAPEPNPYPMPSERQPPEPEADLLGIFVRPVHHAGLPYVVAGSVAAMYFSEPRLTIDVDIPIFLKKRDLPVVSGLFPEPDFYCPPEEILAVEADRECRGHFNVIHIPTGLKADFYPANGDATFGWAWQHKLTVESDSGELFLAPPEYVILWKLVFYQEGKSQKHLRDIARILAVQSELPHMDFLAAAIRERGLQAAWEEARTGI
jgi:hypothetical protein